MIYLLKMDKCGDFPVHFLSTEPWLLIHGSEVMPRRRTWSWIWSLAWKTCKQMLGGSAKGSKGLGKSLGKCGKIMENPSWIWENVGKSIINSEIFSWENHQKILGKILEIDIGHSPTKIRRFEIDGNIIKLNFRKNPRLMTPGGTWAQDLGKIWEARNGEYWNYSLVI